MKLNICLLHEDPFTKDMPARPAITEIYGEYFPDFGHNVTWVTPTIIKDKKIKHHKFKKVNVYSVPFNQNDNISKKIISFFSHYYKTYKFLKKMFKSDKFDIIQVRNNVYYSLIGIRIAKKYKIPFIFQYSFPTAKYKKQTQNKWYLSLEGRIEELLTKHILKKADFIFPISKWMKNDLLKQNVPEKKMMAIPLGINHKKFYSKTNGEKIRKKYNLNNSNVILYAGSMDKTRRLDIIIKAFLKIENKKNKLIMVGEGNDIDRLKKITKELSIKNIIFTGRVPYSEMPNFIAASDICLCPVPPISIYKISSPTKLFEYMIMKKPIITNIEIPEQKNVIEKSKSGILVDFQEQKFADAINKLLKTKKERKKLGENGYKWVIQNRTYEKMAKNIEKKYLKLIKIKG